jgi:uncharacterized membrane protein
VKVDEKDAKARVEEAENAAGTG